MHELVKQPLTTVKVAWTEALYACVRLCETIKKIHSFTPIEPANMSITNFRGIKENYFFSR